MAWYNSLKDLTGDIGGGIKAVGKAVAPIAPIAGLIPGVGGLIAKGVGMIPGLGGAGDAAGSFLKDHGSQIVQGLAGVDAVRQQQQARDTQNRAMGYATDSYDARAPLRAAGQAGMLNPKAPPALQALNYGSSGNAYGKKSPIPAIAPVRPS